MKIVSFKRDHLIEFDTESRQMSDDISIVKRENRYKEDPCYRWHGFC